MWLPILLYSMSTALSLVMLDAFVDPEHDYHWRTIMLTVMLVLLGPMGTVTFWATLKDKGVETPIRTSFKRMRPLPVMNKVEESLRRKKIEEQYEEFKKSDLGRMSDEQLKKEIEALEDDTEDDTEDDADTEDDFVGFVCANVVLDDPEKMRKAARLDANFIKDVIDNDRRRRQTESDEHSDKTTKPERALEEQVPKKYNDTFEKFIK